MPDVTSGLQAAVDVGTRYGIICERPVIIQVTNNTELLALLSRLSSARVAAWCWIRAGYPEMRWHAEHHLGHLCQAWASGELESYGLRG